MITKEKRKMLERQGFTQGEIERLVALRGTLLSAQEKEETRFRRHLEFLRWLIENGRLTEEIL